ncbi:hypothetical protein [Mesoplasma lactucae]|uniref:Uncharacterized protein n=1 Tax=Mesoplasma lactucae ATCC 49193 TaxID=81460 RepID=A0A291IST1_9MOLU|nr:hypothetical protein [Mesoplasma lactucae]ATG97794.1 hypothetical protein CP520_03595 [Mesoplasma lactucae ATCC 49193]ATZ20428.1 hypothetical protein MLACT_v1c06070 [Mesoplasma lactucae ATCC 49193]MCL8216600.1 hypothetical protein [Mesoplasma lactucae ATCC 49193]
MNKTLMKEKEIRYVYKLNNSKYLEIRQWIYNAKKGFEDKRYWNRDCEDLVALIFKLIKENKLDFSGVEITKEKLKTIKAYMALIKELQRFKDESNEIERIEQLIELKEKETI